MTSELLELKQKLLSNVPRFARQILPIFTFLKWKWCISPQKYECPSEEQIIETCNSLIEKTFNNYKKEATFSIVRTGGICVEIWGQENFYEGYLRFEVAEVVESV